jgi:hypothetical protein
MLSLYFNCRLTEQRLTIDRPDSGYFYPVTYPQRIGAEIFNQYAVLLKTIETYAVFKFDTVIFNLAIDIIDDKIEEELKKLITDNYSASKIIIKMTRPSTVKDWINDTADASAQIKKNCPVLVVMNHDHPFIDYTPHAFNAFVEKVFPEMENNLGKALYYSHAPEVISWAVNGRARTKFIKQHGSIYKSEVIDHWIDTICVMTMETLAHVWSKAKFSGPYIGRVDWVGVEYSKLALTTYVFPREFFKHFDGYGHITGMRLISDIGNTESTALQYPSKNDNSSLVNFYYQRWLDTQLLSVRDSLRSGVFAVASRKSLFTKAIEESLDLFRVGYLNADVAAGLIDERRMLIVEVALRGHIYYYGNSLFDSIKTDILLMEGDTISKFKKFIPPLFLPGLRFLKKGVSRIVKKVRKF